MKLLEVKNLSFRYKNSSAEVFRDITFDASEGELILVCGATACGKTTLLKCLKPELAPSGNINGSIIFGGESLNKISPDITAKQIGYVMQRPESQTVTDCVRSELAFCGESLGLPINKIQRQVAETAAYFGLEKILDSQTSKLSGGQLQLLNLASVIAVNPRLIILDEPTSQLDPIAAGDFLRTLFRITRELSVTVIVAEHRFEDLLPIADKILMLENGSLKFFGTPKESILQLAANQDICYSLPCGQRIYCNYPQLKTAEPPLTLGESREMLLNYFGNEITEPPLNTRKLSTQTAIKLKNICFTYESNNSDVINGASFEIKKGEVFSLLGSNGSGKSTLLSIIAGFEKPYRGSIEIFEKNQKKYKNNELYHELLSYLPQDVQSSFLFDTVGEELENTADMKIYDFSEYYNAHPYDLSGGQQQLLGIQKILSSNPKIILFDEPTKGLDGSWRNKITEVIKTLRDNNITILIVTHDMELAAECSDRCGILFDGRISSIGIPSEIFNDSIFYTTNAAKTSRGIYKNVCTSSQLINITSLNGLRGNSK